MKLYISKFYLIEELSLLKACNILMPVCDQMNQKTWADHVKSNPELLAFDYISDQCQLAREY